MASSSLAVPAFFSSPLQRIFHTNITATTLTPGDLFVQCLRAFVMQERTFVPLPVYRDWSYCFPKDPGGTPLGYIGM